MAEGGGNITKQPSSSDAACRTVSGVHGTKNRTPGALRAVSEGMQTPSPLATLGAEEVGGGGGCEKHAILLINSTPLT